MTTTLVKIDQSTSEIDKMSCENHGVCAICLDKIVLQEAALVKGCEHAYCVTCILLWASCSQKPTCPQCKHPFEFLNLHRSLDGSIQDYMYEESVCLLLRATWFIPLVVEPHKKTYHEPEEYYPYEEDDDHDPYEEGGGDDDDLDEVYFGTSPTLRIGNRRWGDNGYVRAGRQEARPAHHPNLTNSGGAGSSRANNKNEHAKVTTGRRAKRALKREAADKAAAEKHEHHLLRMGLK